jgi:CheY-like chemotaxis protein
LLIEDHPDAADSLRLLLTLSRYEVRVASTGRAGIELAVSWRPDWIVSDLGLPEVDGMEVAQALRANPTTAHIPLIALTAYSDGAIRSQAKAAGFDEFLVKRADFSDLQAVLSRGQAVH